MTGNRASVEALIFDAYGMPSDTHCRNTRARLPWSWGVSDAVRTRESARIQLVLHRWRRLSRRCVNSLVTVGLPADDERVEKWATAYDRLTLYPDVLSA